MAYASSCTRPFSALVRVSAMLFVATLIAALAQDARAGPPVKTTIYNTAYTIKAEIATTATSYNYRNGWGGVISGIYYRPSGSGGWGTNMIDDEDWGRDLQVALYEAPPSAYFASTGLGNWPWNPVQGGDGVAYACPAWITDSGSSPVPWLSIRTYPYDWANSHEECVQLDQTVYMWPTYIEIRYAVSGRSGYSCHHRAMFQESPVLFAYAHGLADPSVRLSVEKWYDGTAPWTAGTLTGPLGDPPATGVETNQAYPTEHWIGLFRPNNGYGLTLAYPMFTRHQPYVHHWSFFQSLGGEVLRSRAYFDVRPGSGETISWTTYVIPGTVQTGRETAYCLLPHRTWEFNLGAAPEGWQPVNQMSNFYVQSGILKARSTGTDPYMYSLDQLDYASDSVYGLTIRMAVTAGTWGAVYYITEEDQAWNEAKAKWFPITADGTYRTYFVQLDNISGWAGKTLKRLRLDPTNAATGTDGIKINYLRLVQFPEWEFNAAGNNEGWMPVTKPVWDPVWPGNVTGGNLVLGSDGKILDTYTDPDSWIYPSLLGPHDPTLMKGTTGIRYVQMRIYLQGTQSFTCRLKYTLTTDDKLFDYHGSGNTLITRFDLAGHTPITWSNLAANTWHGLSSLLPSSGDIDQLLLEPTDKAGIVYIDYIRVFYI